MKVAIVHYHLGQGGVSRVICAASRMMSEAGIAHVILAGPTPGIPDVPLHSVDQLGYREIADPDLLLEQLLAAAHAGLGGPPHIWHFHNHSLGKNPALPRIVARLASAGGKLVLQIHDLAEDGRPDNARIIGDRGELYPSGPHIHYAFVNSRDRDRFIASGLEASNAHLLPNPVDFAPSSPAPCGAPLLFYPVRGIRRKNLGEILMLASLAPSGTRFAISRAPLNPAARIIHDSWQRFSDEIELPVGFDVVNRISPDANNDSTFENWLSSATHFVTTSVSEGFGMVFPESTARGRPLLGRNLPHVIRDHGIHAGCLYDRLLVPEAWIDSKTLRQCRIESMEGSWSAWKRPPPSIDEVDDPVDFGNLPEILQQRIICKLRGSGMKELPLVEIHGQCRPAVEWLSEALAIRTPDMATSPPQDSYLHHLTGIYEKLTRVSSVGNGFIDAERILDAYLTPDNFHFLTSPIPKRRVRPDFASFRAIVFDVYGTLLAAPAGGVKPDPAADPLICGILSRHGHSFMGSPSAALHEAVRRHHASAGIRYPEVDLLALWHEVLDLEEDAEITDLVTEIENVWHPARIMPGVEETLHRLAANDIALGLLSNAQCNTPNSLGSCAHLFTPDLTILSYQHGKAKPSPELFELLAARLERRGIATADTLYIGNDPLHDIEPAAARGFRTALFTGDPDSHRHGFCLPDFEIRDWKS